MQRGSIKKHGKWWVLKYREDVLKNGVRARKDMYKNLAPIDRLHQTKESVQPLADVALASINVADRPALSADSVQAFLEMFLIKNEGGRGHKLRPKTVKSYNDMFKLAKPHLPDMELRRVRTPDINQIMRAVAGADREERRAQSVYYNLKNFLSSAFRYAVGHGFIESNPVRDAIIPEGEDSDTHAYTLAEIHEIVQAVKNQMTKAAILTATFTGLRMSEIKGLRWEDYDGKVLNVRRGVVEGIVGDTKTKTSKAPVPVVKTLKKVLAEHLKNNSGEGYIFHGETGEPIRFENLGRRDIEPMLEGKNVQWHGLHACRRGLASILHDKRVDTLVVKHILRQSVKGVAEEHYIKPSLERMRAALELAEKDYLKIRKRHRKS
ncbi:MAG: tyrosine-type recombinase/integrase [Candidatus Acidiferrum sp.]